MNARRVHGGLALVEFVAALTVMALMAGIAAVAYRRAEPVAAASECEARLGAARIEAVARRRPATITLHIDGAVYDATARPDGSIVFAGPGGRDGLDGRPGCAT